jgi:hypothetical protein
MNIQMYNNLAYQVTGNSLKPLFTSVWYEVETVGGQSFGLRADEIASRRKHSKVEPFKHIKCVSIHPLLNAVNATGND